MDSPYGNTVAISLGRAEARIPDLLFMPVGSGKSSITLCLADTLFPKEHEGRQNYAKAKDHSGFIKIADYL
jgi:hypothetical protein